MLLLGKIFNLSYVSRDVPKLERTRAPLTSLKNFFVNLILLLYPTHITYVLKANLIKAHVLKNVLEKALLCPKIMHIFYKSF